MGVLHKLITIGTPHLGTPIAYDLLQSTCVGPAIATRGNVAIATATVPGYASAVNGAVSDLVGDGNNDATLSPALQFIQNAGGPIVPTATIAGETLPANLSGLNAFPSLSWSLHTACPSSDTLAADLTPANWNNVFPGQANDAIVPASSQLNAGTGPVISGVIHTDGLFPLNFNGPAELSQDSLVQAASGGSSIQNSVINLLNSSITTFSCQSEGGSCTVPQLRSPR